jgi:Fe-S-cluster containining protein
MPQMYSYYEARGWVYEKKQRMLWIPSVCPHLTPDNKCDIYENRPDYCKIWTGFPMLRMPPGGAPKCGYGK